MQNVWDFLEIGLSKMLFSTAVTEYMSDKGKRLRATTLEGYRSAIRCHLMPMWGKREIETISFEEVQDWVDGFDLPGAAEKAYKTFRQIYRWVLRRHQLRIWDVTQGVELPQKPTVRRPTLTAKSYGRSVVTPCGSIVVSCKLYSQLCNPGDEVQTRFSLSVAVHHDKRDRALLTDEGDADRIFCSARYAVGQQGYGMLCNRKGAVTASR